MSFKLIKPTHTICATTSVSLLLCPAACIQILRCNTEQCLKIITIYIFYYFIWNYNSQHFQLNVHMYSYILQTHPCLIETSFKCNRYLLGFTRISELRQNENEHLRGTAQKLIVFLYRLIYITQFIDIAYNVHEKSAISDMLLQEILTYYLRKEQ